MSEIVVTPLKIHLVDINRDIDLNIYSGILGISQDPKTLCIKPELGFLITEKLNDFENIEINQEKSTDIFRDLIFKRKNN